MNPHAYECPDCGFDLWIPVANLAASVVGLYDDNRFPGRCLVVLREHHEHLALLEPDLLNLFMADIQAVGRALHEVTGAQRINYALLGNAVAHLHAHVIPRFGTHEPRPDRTPWEHPSPRDSLGEQRILELQRQVARHLDD